MKAYRERGCGNNVAKLETSIEANMSTELLMRETKHNVGLKTQKDGSFEGDTADPDSVIREMHVALLL